jgi:hypothetical protein
MIWKIIFKIMISRYFLSMIWLDHDLEKDHDLTDHQKQMRLKMILNLLKSISFCF